MAKKKKTVSKDEIIMKVVEATKSKSPGTGSGGSGKPVTGWSGPRGK
jgi:hypothetical protein